MQEIDAAKKSDWHPADIVAALRKKGWSLRQLSIAHDYHPQTLRRALSHPYPNAEKLIAKALGLKPQAIWPARYAARAVRHVQHSKSSAAANQVRNTQAGRAA